MSETSYVISNSLAARALKELRQRRIHPLFAGYLHLLAKAKSEQTLGPLRPEFLDFYRTFFFVKDHPVKAPYIRPFINTKASDRNLWMNENVAGSYAPSSLREGQPFRKVVDVDEGEGTYRLHPEHAKEAFHYLLGEKRVACCDLALLLYRDFAFVQPKISGQHLVDGFAFDFGFSSKFASRKNAAFYLLFDDAVPSDLESITLSPLAREHGQKQSGQSSASWRSTMPVRHLTASEMLQGDEVPRERNPAIKRLVVEGLLSFGGRCEFEFGRLNVLVGPNGSGKSNLIDCLRLFQQSPNDIQQVFEPNGFEPWIFNGQSKETGAGTVELHVSSPRLPSLISHQFRLGPALNGRAQLEEAIFEVATGGKPGQTYFTGSYRSAAVLNVAGSRRRREDRELTSKQYNPFKSILSQVRDATQYPEITALLSLYSDLRIYSDWTFGRHSKLRDPAPAGRSDTRLPETIEGLPLALNALERTRAHEVIMRLLPELKETYRDYVTRLVFGQIGLELVEEPFARTVPAARLSDGTLRFLALAAILVQPDPPPVICIEEPELGMHPDMVRLVAGMIADAAKVSQVFITTHSESLLTALQDDFEAIFAFSGDGKGTAISTFDQKQFVEWREKHNLGELWTIGQIGGNRW